MKNKENLQQFLNDSITELNITKNTLTENTEHMSLVEFFVETNLIPSYELISLLEAGFFNNMLRKGFNTDARLANVGQSIGQGLSNAGSKIADVVNPNRVVNRTSPMISVGDNKGVKYYVFPDLSVNDPGYEDVLNAIVKNETEKTGKNVQIVPPGTIGMDKAKAVKLPPPGNQKQQMLSTLDGLNKLINAKIKEFQGSNFISPKQLELIKQDISKALGEVSSEEATEQKTEQQAIDTTANQIAQDMTATISNKVGTNPQPNQTALQNQPQPLPNIPKNAGNPNANSVVKRAFKNVSNQYKLKNPTQPLTINHPLNEPVPEQPITIGQEPEQQQTTTEQPQLQQANINSLKPGSKVVVPGINTGQTFNAEVTNVDPTSGVVSVKYKDKNGQDQIASLPKESWSKIQQPVQQEPTPAQQPTQPTTPGTTTTFNTNQINGKPFNNTFHTSNPNLINTGTSQQQQPNKLMNAQYIRK